MGAGGDIIHPNDSATLVISAIIFIAVLVDSSRSSILERLERRQIRVERA
jgi:hypothetical protein